MTSVIVAIHTSRRAVLALVFGSLGALTAGCVDPDAADWDVPFDESEALAVGTIPAGLPPRVLVGLFEDTGATWMKSSGVPWDVRYRYFTKGWVNNWGWSGYDGSFATTYLDESRAQGYIPAIQYYQVNGEAGGGEAQFLQKVQTPATMASYFKDFKILMQRVKEHGKPTLILIEADGVGLLQQQTGSNPGVAAAVASTGLPELAGLPNTVAGWGLAFLQLRKAVGADNAILGIHISGWASGKDIAHFSVTDPLQPEVDKVYNFLAPLGLGANVTGQTYDVLVGDPLDRDANFYKLTLGQDRWWDPADNASISSRSFNRYAEWLRLWNVKSNRRWVLWQIPCGNSNHLDVPNQGSARQGYKDNRPEYFFKNGTAHVAKFADSGVIALLFGAGTGGQSSYGNDLYVDGKSFLKTYAKAFYDAGGVPLGAIPWPGDDDGGADGGGDDGDPAQYDFESGAQGWTTSGGFLTGVAVTGSQAFAGAQSLAVSFGGNTSGSQRVFVNAPAAPAGALVSFRVRVPSGSKITAVQPYVQQGAAGGWAWSGSWQSIQSFTPGTWRTITVQVPAGAATPLHQLGVEFTTSAAWTGTVHIDAVTW